MKRTKLTKRIQLSNLRSVILELFILSLLLSCEQTKKTETSGKEEAKRPNVLFIAIDDLRPELGTYGSEHILSPNIDKLATEGVQFNRAYCQAPHCMPIRASMLTGIQQTQANLLMDIEDYANGAPSLPETFRRAGYHTVSNGKIFHNKENLADQSWSEPPFSLVNGDPENNHTTFYAEKSAEHIIAENSIGAKNIGPYFEASDVPDSAYIDGQTCNKTIRNIKRLAKSDQLFFITNGFVRPHLPFYAPKKYWDLYDRDEIALAEKGVHTKKCS